MKFFKRMNNIEILNSKRAAIIGFYTYMLITAVNYFAYLLMEKDLFSSPIIFWSGLVVAFGYEALLNFKEKRKSGYKSPDGWI